MVEPAQIFTFFFVTLGPLKLIAPFAFRTRDVDLARSRRIGLWAFAVATISVLAGGLLGSNLLVTWRVSMPALQLSGGIVFFLVAMRQLLEQYEPAREAAEPPPLPDAPLAGRRPPRVPHAADAVRRGRGDRPARHRARRPSGR